jgi:chromosome segregation protein
VLGEQSTGLGGKKTDDMIFSGSEHRPRAGMAQATITFDNTDMWLPVDFSEVALARHAHRDGRNEYLLNSQHVRLRDINELLSQAGLSESTYTILGQGMVDASLALKAEDRRLSSGGRGGQYRAPRRGAEATESTERNLERGSTSAELAPPSATWNARQSHRACAQEDLKVVLLSGFYHWHCLARLATRESQSTGEAHSVARHQHEEPRRNILPNVFRPARRVERGTVRREIHTQRESVSQLAFSGTPPRTDRLADVGPLRPAAAMMNSICHRRFNEADQEAARPGRTR